MNYSASKNYSLQQPFLQRVRVFREQLIAFFQCVGVIRDKLSVMITALDLTGTAKSERRVRKAGGAAREVLGSMQSHIESSFRDWNAVRTLDVDEVSRDKCTTGGRGGSSSATTAVTLPSNQLEDGEHQEG